MTYTTHKTSNSAVMVRKNGVYAGWLERVYHKAWLQRPAFYDWSGVIDGVSVRGTVAECRNKLNAVGAK